MVFFDLTFSRISLCWNRTLFTCLMLGVTGCDLVDQRSFDPDAGKPPTPYIPSPPPGTAVAPKAPFLQIMDGTPETDYGPAIDSAVKIALQRKANILFIVQGLAPMEATPDKQLETLTTLTKQLLTPIATRIIAAGAQPIQVEMQTATDPALHQAAVRVNVR